MSTPGAAPQRFGCYIGNIDSTVSLDILKEVFGSCGTIVDASLNGRTEDPYRFGFIDFATEEARAKALKYNGFTLVGRKLRVNVSKGNVGKPEGYGNPSPRENRASHQANHFAPAPAAAAPGGLTAAEHQQAQFLLQLIQQGSVDPQTLTEAQRTLLVAALSGGSGTASGGAATAEPTPSPASAAPAAVVPPAMAAAPPMGMYNPMWGPYGAMGPYGAPMMAPGMMMNMYGQPQMGHMGGQRPHRAAAANPPPSEEVVKMREIQRKQFLKVVKEETEAYEKKRREREGKGEERSGDDSSDSDAEGGEERREHSRNHEEKKVRMDLSASDEKSE